jgi:N-methylhydantoinase A
MVNGIRRVTVERGYDPRDFVLVAGGGATGAHITALAKEMGIDTVLVSKLSSGLCAYGQIISDVKYNFMATIPTRLNLLKAAEEINNAFKGIESEGIKYLNKDGFEEKNIKIYRSLEMRYVGQIHECTVNIDFFEITNETLENIKEAFHNRHKELYTYSETESPVELVNIESTIYGKIDRPTYLELENKGQINDALKTSRNLIFSETGNLIKTPVYDGNKLSPGHQINGPAVVEEDTTTLVIEPEWFLELHKSGTYIIKKKKTK